MIEPEEECELQQLVPSEEEHNMGEQCGEITPPVTPNVARLTQKSPPSPNTKVKIFCISYINFIHAG